ncbi:Nuclear receptor-binding protein 2 [Liparis tanakae]|uniref:Nuclear receptor-binding protein 2 n=1 Tax=Liparis tanakae TaxID=230148 RepID=A0A4Z2H3U5_9TELE|nr:Nuclear receptor-binding protein 2 [Liparis tanakae]
MTMSVPERKSGSEGKEEESEDESEILEESPCGRWQKRKEQVSQGNVPGVESASLAMDTEEGVEVVWNEVLFSDKKVFKAQEETIKEMFENLMQVEHPNIVKFHKYWLDMKESQARFLKKTKKNHKTMNVKVSVFSGYKRLSPGGGSRYLHSCEPPIIHANLTCDTIFIQHNGLIKIGSVFPDASVHSKARQHRDEQRNLHFFAPEYGSGEDDYAIDIFSFGICALEMAVLEIQANGDTAVSKEAVVNAGQSLEDPPMREFTQSCLRHEAKLRPTAHDLLFHRVLFEVHSLKLLAAHCLINNQYSHVSPLELDKFLEDVKNGIYPLMNFASSRPHPVPRALSLSHEQVETVKTPTPEPQETESRKVVQMHCNLESNEEGTKTHLSLFLKMDDKLHRQLSCDILPTDTSKDLASELVHYAFINEEDSEKVAGFLDDAICRHRVRALASGSTQ